MTPTDMGPAHIPTGRRRRALVAVPASAESVPQRPQRPPQAQPHQPPHPPHAPGHPYQPHAQPPAQPHPQPAFQQPHLQDPPIYRALIRHWSDRGRTLPGHPDPEWVRLAAPPVRHGQFGAALDLSGSRDPRGDAR
ncbi:hypothetical protein ACFWZ2_37815 [Streptomyces sp. NPDC059002]|uniref:hypothetical protein n=1 Tax=Streptomyces sp. NPDC059002 TaxID=3346690 RepID=UPI0036B79C95